MSKASFEVKDVFRWADRATYTLTGGRLKLGSDVSARQKELDAAEASFNPFDAPLCSVSEPLTIASIALLLAEQKPLPTEHEPHEACVKMYERLAKKQPSSALRAEWLQRRKRIAADAGCG